jgi:hypothetical protein
MLAIVLTNPSFVFAGYRFHGINQRLSSPRENDFDRLSDLSHNYACVALITGLSSMGLCFSRLSPHGLQLSKPPTHQ